MSMSGELNRLGGGTVSGRSISGDRTIASEVVQAEQAIRESLAPFLGIPSPLLLMPLRLEYRVATARGVGVSDLGLSGPQLSDEILAALPKAKTPSKGTGRTSRRTRWLDPKLARQVHILFRWYPDHNFAREGVAPASEAETLALAEANETLAGANWFAEHRPRGGAGNKVAADTAQLAFDRLASTVGAARAVHLLRTGGVAAEDWEEHIGRLAGRPRRVALYALTGGAATKLGHGATIPSSFAYDGELFASSHWMFDFDQVVTHGMGMRLTDSTLVAKALAAEWIIAVGLSTGDATDDIEQLIGDGVANGGFAFLKQGTTTNNVPDQPIIELDRSGDLATFRSEAADHERGRHQESLEEASDLLAEALGIDRLTVQQGARSADLGTEDARAMIRVIGPALLEQLRERTYLPSSFGSVMEIDNDDVVDFFAKWISSRGALPTVRFGDCPYGILPLTNIDELRPVNDATEHDQRLREYVRGLARNAAFGQKVLVDKLRPIEPGDPQTSQKLEEVLKKGPVSRRVDVGDEVFGDTAPVGCPYVTGKNHRPADYLAAIRTQPLSALDDPTEHNLTWPLLYRLARQAATRRVVQLVSAVAVVADEGFAADLSEAVVGLGETATFLQDLIDINFVGLDPDRSIVEPPDLPVVSGPTTPATGDVRAPARPSDTPITDGPDGTVGRRRGRDPTRTARLQRATMALNDRRRTDRPKESLTQFDPELIATDAAKIEDVAKAIKSVAKLGRLSITELANMETLSGFSGDALTKFKGYNRNFSAALSHLESIALRPDGDAQLERLMLETFDLFQHRSDAWASGLAYRSLVERRRAGVTGLQAGYYGMIGKLRTESDSGRTDGYIQAPSLDQAVTVAAARSAHLRHPDSGAFDIDLSSERVRAALGLFDLLGKGLSLGEALGLAGERVLHDRRVDRLILVLRKRFPLSSDVDGATDSTEIRLFDGMAFVKATINFGPADDRQVLRQVKAELADRLDALSDLIMLEALHQRTIGNLEASNAWMQVLSGESTPSAPVFVRTRRSGHGSSHRVMVVLPAVEAPTGAPPRTVAAPTYSELLEGNLSGFDECRVRVVFTSQGDSDSPVVLQREFNLAADLAMTPLDLAIGGGDEVRVRALAAFVRFWQNDAATSATLAPPATMGDVASLGTTEFATNIGTVKADKLIDLARRTQQVIESSRVIDVGDLQAASSVDSSLNDAEAAAVWSGGVDRLVARIDRLVVELAGLVTSLRVDLDRVVVAAGNREAALALDRQADVTALQAVLATALNDLHRQLESASRFGEPAAIILTATDITAGSAELFAEHGAAIVARLNAKLDRLGRARTEVTVVDSAEKGRSLWLALQDALQATLDGRALPVLPPLQQADGARLVLDQATTVNRRLGTWIQHRSKVKAVVKMSVDFRFKAFPVSATAFDDEQGDPTADQRPETVAPRTSYFGTVLSSAAQPASLTTVAGFVVDEWAESRPSERQSTGVALNYDAPQSEAPQCLLLCEPPASTFGKIWTEKKAVDMVAEAIKWMKIRALAGYGPWLPGANRVPHKQAKNRTTRRIPKQSTMNSGPFATDFAAATFINSPGVIHEGELNEADF